MRSERLNKQQFGKWWCQITQKSTDTQRWKVAEIVRWYKDKNDKYVAVHDFGERDINDVRDALEWAANELAERVSTSKPEPKASRETFDDEDISF